MKKLLLLTAALGMLFASPAMAQSFLNPGGDCPEGLVEQGDFCTTPEAAQATQDDPFACEGLPTDEAFIACLDELSAPVPSGFVPPASTEVPEAAPTMTALPDTSGASLIALGAGALLVAGGLLIRRR